MMTEVKDKQAVAFLNQAGRPDSDLASLDHRGASSAKNFCSLVPLALPRHCEERSDEAIHLLPARCEQDGLLRCARNDGEGPTPQTPGQKFFGYFFSKK
jgi:hypothetical protein